MGRLPVTGGQSKFNKISRYSPFEGIEEGEDADTWREGGGTLPSRPFACRVSGKCQMEKHPRK